MSVSATDRKHVRGGALSRASNTIVSVAAWRKPCRVTRSVILTVGDSTNAAVRARTRGTPIRHLLRGPNYGAAVRAEQIVMHASTGGCDSIGERWRFKRTISPTARRTLAGFGRRFMTLPSWQGRTVSSSVAA